MSESGQQPVVPPGFSTEPVDPYPYPESHDLRTEPKLHPALSALVPYIGVWRGRGQGGYPTIDDFTYAQEIRFSHDGRPFLYYESRSWLIDADGKAIRPAAREVGWWRPQPDNELEVLLTHPTGVTELYLGTIDGVKVELATDAVLRSASAKEVNAGVRLYGIVDGALMYAYDMGAVGHRRQPHLSARLERVAG